MTTIAWDGATLAADSQSSADNAICTLREQKIFYPDNAPWFVNDEVVLAVGTAGDCGIEPQLFELMENNLTYKSEFTPEPDFTALAITGIGRAWIISKNGGNTHASVSLQIDSYAIGSGSMIARAVMHCDKGAEYAVKVATELDIYSGGDIQTFTAETEMQKRVKDE